MVIDETAAPVDPRVTRRHDIRAQVSVIHAHSQLLRRRALHGQTPTPDELLTRLDDVDRSIDRLLALLDQLARDDAADDRSGA